MTEDKLFASPVCQEDEKNEEELSGPEEDLEIEEGDEKEEDDDEREEKEEKDDDDWGENIE